MPVAAAGFGVLIAGLGLLGLVSPAWYRRLVSRFRNRIGMWLSTGIPLVFGFVFVLAASDSQAPVAFYVIGGVMIATAGILPGMGTSWFSRKLTWWMRRRDSLLRSWGVVALALGILVAYGAMP
jgi:uncharacterized membrane protein YidH (DUF202 family)